MKNVLIYLCLFCAYFSSNAQISVTNSNNATNLVNRLVGPGVTFTNATITCANNGAGSFVSNQATLTMDSGIVLTTGFANSSLADTGINKPASWFASEDRPNPITADPNLLAASGISSANFHDMCRLEFDFVPQGDTLTFNYKFGSEEYPEWVCSQYNDIFGFFISGTPGFPIATNLALVPGTNVPVAINYINSGIAGLDPNTGLPFSISNCKYFGQGPFPAFFINNSSSNAIVYDGITTKLTAKAVVTPCSTYHMKFAIADIYDGEFDSGVFLEAGSFKSEGVVFDKVVWPSSLPINWPYSTEGCNSATIYLKRPKIKSTPQTIYVTVGGSAINGVDYVTIPTTVVIPANDTVTTITVTSLLDALPEGTETLFIGLKTVSCNVAYSDTMTILINEFPNYTITDNDSICIGSSKLLSASLLATDSNIKFLWKPGNFNGANLNITPFSTSLYTVTAIYPGCPSRDSIVKIDVSPIPTINAGVDTNICPGGTVTLNAISTATPPYPLIYAWSPNSSLTGSFGLTPAASPTTNTNYTVTATNIVGCKTTDVVLVTIKPTLNINANVTQPTCTVPNATVVASNTQGALNTNYTLLPLGISNATGIFSGLVANTNYTISATNSAYCSKSTAITINNFSPNNFTLFTITNIACTGGFGKAQVSSNGFGTKNYTLQPINLSNSTGTFNNLTPNTYTITSEDANGCVTSSTFLITAPSNIIINAPTITNVSCFNGNNGSIFINASGGNSVLNFSIMPNISTYNSGGFSNLSSNVYTIQITDANNCIKTSSVTINNAPQLILTAPNISLAKCNPLNSGAITFSGSGGTGSLTYTINNGVVQNNTTGIFNNLNAGTYTVSISDANSCSQATTTAVTTFANPNLTVTNTTNVLCNGNATGSIVSNVLNPNGVIIYSIIPNTITNNNTGTFSNAIANIYTITATDGNGCLKTTSVQITQPNLLQLSIPTTTPTLCNNTPTGSLSTSATGGFGSITYILLNTGLTQATGNFGGLGASIYTIMAQDGNNCTTNITAQIVQPSTLNWNTNLITNNPSCFNFNNGSFSLSASGGTNTINYKLNNGAPTNTASYSNLTANNYTVVANDVNGCNISTVVILSNPANLVINNANSSLLTCDPGNDANISLQAIGGTGILNFNLQGNSLNLNNTTGNFNNLGGGNYVITVTDANSCVKVTSLFIITPSNPIINGVQVVNTKCLPNNTGSIQINATTINGAIGYSIGASFVPTSLFNNLSANNYTITVKDNLACTAASIVQINTTTKPIITNTTATLTACDPACNGIINIAATGGTGLLSYNLNSITQTSNTFNNLCANTYTAQVKDANGCEATTIILLNKQPNPTIISTTVSNVLCNAANNGSIVINANGGTPGYSYNLNGGIYFTSNTFNNLGPGTYTVTVKDFYGCTNSSLASVIQPSSLLINSTSINYPLCNNIASGTFSVNATGGNGTITFISTGNATNIGNGNFTNVLGGIVYTVTVNDANNCSISTLINVTQPSAISINNLATDSATCYNFLDGGISISGIGGAGLLSYTLGTTINNTGNFISLAGGSYNVVVKDANNCTLNTSVIVPAPAPLNFKNLLNTPITCNNLANGAISCGASGGLQPYGFNLNNGALSANANYTNLNTGTYTLQVKDAYNCTRSTLVTITQPLPLTFNSVNITNINCFGNNNGIISFASAGGNGSETFSINPNSLPPNFSGTFFPLSANTYTLTITDAKNCIATSIATITQPNLLTINTTLTNPKCNNSLDGKIIVITAGGNGGNNYTLQPINISNLTGVFSNLGAGVYTIEVADNNGCAASSFINLLAPSPVTISNINITDVTCFGSASGTINATATGGFGNLQFALLPTGTQNNNGVFTNLLANTYSIQVKDANNCTFSSLAIVSQNAQLIINTKFTNPRCSGGNDGVIELQGTGGKAPYEYKFNNGNWSGINVFNNLILGSYTVALKDAANCEVTSIIVLNTPESLIAKIDSVRDIYCASANNGSIFGSAQFGNSGGYTFYLTPTGKINYNGIFTDLKAGIYTLTARDNLGCSGTITTIIKKLENVLQLSFTIDSATCIGLGLDGAIRTNIINGVPPYTYSWLPTKDSAEFISKIGYGTYSLTVVDYFGCSVTQEINFPPVACCNLALPNAFTPNADDVNDRFKPFGPADYSIEQFEIFDRWGNKVFKTINKQDFWDGKYKGNLLDMDTFFYIFKYKCLFDNSYHLLKGDVILFK